MEILVACSCGNTFGFDEEPVNGQMGSPVNCPMCRTDVTHLANEHIRRVLQGNPAPPKKSFWQSIGLGSARAPQPVSVPIARSDEDAEHEPAALPGGISPRHSLAAFAAVAVAALCAYGWYQLAIYTGFYFGFLAWITGGIVGLACRLIAPSGGIFLASLAGLSAFGSIAAGHMMVMHAELQAVVPRFTRSAYSMNQDYARAALELKNTNAMREFLASHFVQYEIGDKLLTTEEPFGPTQARNLAFMRDKLLGMVNLPQVPRQHARFQRSTFKSTDVTEAHLTAFQEKELPALKNFLDGVPSQAEWTDKLSAAIFSQISWETLFAGSLTPHSVAWMLFGFLLAYKLARNKSETENI